jgi:hypothetical protein
VVTFKNNFDDSVTLSVREQLEAQACDRSVGPQVVALAPGATTEIAVAEGRKLCFSMGRDLSKPLTAGICVARASERVALPAWLGCYRQ